ncbi:MAG TPA: SpoIIE family protein phosphatase [Actinomycetota bacterium]|nr:SpoIIE family protein phosphatase [Actinomycetota bacterium]
MLRPASDLRFVLGLILAVTGPVLAAGVDRYAGWRLPAIPFTLAVVAAALVGRIAAGLLAAVLSTILVGWVVLEPQGRWFVDAAAIVNLAAFLVLALVVSWILARADAISEQRRDAARSLSVALRAGSLGTWRWDARTGEVVWDADMERVYGLPPGGFDGRYETYLALQHPDDREEVRETVDRALAQAKGYRIVHRVVPPSGVVRWIEGFAEPVVDPNGAMVGLTGVARDVTEERIQQLERERALRFAERLQTIAADLAAAATREDVAETVVTHGRAAVEADAALFYVLEPEGTLRLLASHGYDEDMLEAYRTMSLDDDGPVLDAVRRAETLLLEDRGAIDERYPPGRDRERVHDRSAVACPVRAGGKVVGALSFAAHRDHAFDDEDLSLLEAIASQSGVALDRASLLASERTSRRELEQLLTVTDVTLSVFDFDELVERLTDRITAVLGVDVTTLLLLTPDRRYLEEIRGRGDPLRIPIGQGLSGKIAATEEPMLVEDLATWDVDPYRPWLKEMTSFLGVPVASRGLVTGVLHVTTRERRAFTPSEVSLLQLAAGRVASSLERTRLYAEREQTGTVLQRAIVPGELPEVPGLDLDGLYVPYAPGEDVGGDFYDVFPTTDGAYLLAIGDVSGKGAAAAAVMGFVRHSLRAIARFVRGPADIVRELNRALLEDSPAPGERFCTVVVARLEPDEGHARLTVARGGHELPLVARRDGAVEEIVEGGPPIGMWADIDVSERSLVLAPGDALVLFTDGLVETPTEERRDVLASLLSVTAGAPAEEILAGLRRALVEPAVSRYDDVAVLVASKR